MFTFLSQSDADEITKYVRLNIEKRESVKAEKDSESSLGKEEAE